MSAAAKLDQALAGQDPKSLAGELGQILRDDSPERAALVSHIVAVLSYEPSLAAKSGASTHSGATANPGTVAIASRETRRALWRHLAGPGFSAAPGLTTDVVLALAEHEAWETRETGAALAGDVLTAHFADFYPTILAFTASPSQNTRRAAALAVMYASKKREPAWVSPILDVLERLLRDRAVYVRKNLGPFAIGSALLLRHPAETLARLGQWARSDDEQVLWNVAMAFSAAPAKAHITEALAILGPLAGHPSRFVWRAAASSLRFLGRHDPGRVIPALEEWRKRPERRAAVDTVMNYLRPPG